MDRSFLSQPAVIEAARNFVCIRLTSYEDETEKQFTAKLVQGDVANTAFAILAPDGTPAVRGRGPGRGPLDLYRDAAEMAKGMNAIAARYPAKNVDGEPALPTTLSAKIGLAVAAGDLQPLVVVVASDAGRRETLEREVAKLAWRPEFAGRFIYASAANLAELPKTQGATVTDGVVVVEPDLFGAGGKVVKEVAGDVVASRLEEVLRDTMRSHVRVVKSRRQLAALGLQEGIFYETNIPVSGRGEAADRERYKEQLESRKKN
ncbi:MAG TPA: hypothetical protein PLV92_15075 [Pirellulaceae bacterium]|nr:hypothetical protein [Pirellulaceae bacterium]